VKTGHAGAGHRLDLVVRRRPLNWSVAVGIAVLLVPACVQASPARRTFESGPQFGGLSFEYPGAWTALQPAQESTISTVIVYLSNQTMVSPCTDGSCGLAVKHLEPGAILVWWSQRGSPGWTFPVSSARGELLTIGGRRALLIVRPGCAFLDGDVFMRTVVEIPHVAENWLELDACIRQPGAAAAETEVRELLDSVHFDTSL
jgi:hypothetical protein